MEVELLYFDGCPHWETVRDRLERVAGARDLRVRPRAIATQAEAEATRFLGSPTIIVDGIDPFARGDEPVGLSCRLYQTPDGLAGSPTVDQLEAIFDG